jgi:hypothetical protein
MASRLLAIVFYFLAAIASPARAAAPRIELYTMGRGDDLFSKFGHAAICVVEDIPGGGTCYNYGTTDFSRPVGLGWEVVRGRALFWLSVSDLESMVRSFQSADRTIYRQSLPLSSAKAIELARALHRDALPENSAYVYNHFLENCSTRPRDHIDRATSGALRRASLPILGSFRDYATEGLAASSTFLVPAGDLVMGRWVDRPIDPYAAMFIPDVLREAVATALGVKPEIVYERRRPMAPPDVRGARARTWIASIAIALGAMGGALFGGPRVRRLVRVIGGLVLGGLGALLLFAALASTLPELQRNELLLVLFPFDFFLLSRSRKLLSSYSTMRLLALALVATLRILGVLRQPLWPFWILSVGVLAAVRASAR